MEQESPPGYLVIACGHEEAYCSDDEERWHTMPDEARQLILDYAESLGRGEPHPNNDICIWFDEGSRKCRYYEWRPDICRETLQVGDDACRAWRESYAHLID
jgi:Fe-S-cluster containining protein